MLRVKKKGFALINTMIIASIMLSLSCLMFKIIENNIEFTGIHYLDDDIFSVDAYEEEVLCDFMKILNKRISSSNINSQENYSDEESYNLFEESFEEENHENVLMYDKNKDKLKLKTLREFDSVRVRELRYRMEDNKVILIPTSHFYDTNSENINCDDI